MRYLTKYKMFESIEVESEIREILSDLTDDDDFNVSVKREATLASMDSDDAILVVIERQDYFKWNDVSDKIQLLCTMLKEKYPIQIVEANMMLTFVDSEGREKFLRTHLQNVDAFGGKLEFNLPDEKWIQSQSRNLRLNVTPDHNNAPIIRAVHCEFVK